MTAEPDSAASAVVVGVDGSDHSAKALRWAAHMAGLFGVPLVAVTAWEWPTSYGWASIPEDWSPAEDMRGVLNHTVREVFGSTPPEHLEQRVVEGGAAPVLIEASKSATLLVVGSRGHGGFAGLLLGSVSGNVAEHAQCPVLIIHGHHAPPPAVPAEPS